MDTVHLCMESQLKEMTIQLRWHVRWILNVRHFVTAQQTDSAFYALILMQTKCMMIGKFANLIQVRNLFILYKALKLQVLLNPQIYQN